jgi:putative phage-type endonuclease
MEEAWDIFFNSFMPYRSYSSSIILSKLTIEYLEHIKRHLDYVRAIPQPEQRTKEWYILRHNLITASNAYKCFESQSMRNQIIFEKCQPLKLEQGNDNDNENANANANSSEAKSTFVNVNTTLHWGQKYEPLSVLIYENLYKTKIEDFGCIPHKDYPFLGASPDGIVVNEDSDRFGRMLEIKNIVNREIDGIPKKEYWVQMQLQMEVWDLNECDFLETKFVEYESYSDYCNDTTDNLKGIIMYFSQFDFSDCG